MPGLIDVPAQLVAAYGLQVWQPFTTCQFINPAGESTAELEVIGGTLTHRSQQWPRTEASIEVVAAVDPADTRPPVVPWGGQVRITTGAQIGLNRWAFRAATLDVASTEIDRPSGRVSVQAVSREARINEDRYFVRDTIGDGLLSAVVTTICRRTIAGLPVRNLLGANDFAVGVDRVPLDNDVWPSVEAVMTAGNSEAVFNGLGELVLRPTPVRASTPVLTFTTAELGTKGGTLTGYSSRRSWAPNKLVMQYREANDTPSATRRNGIWEDTGSVSGTGTAYGRHTEVTRVTVDQGKLPTQETADRAALALARRHRGQFRQVVLRAIPAPWVTPGDTVQVNLLGGTSERLLVRAVTWPLTQLDVMQLDCVDPDYTGS